MGGYTTRGGEQSQLPHLWYLAQFSPIRENKRMWRILIFQNDLCKEGNLQPAKPFISMNSNYSYRKDKQKTKDTINSQI
jgi:hypothetical protein